MPYYECLGLIFPDHETTTPGGWIPKNVVVTAFCPRVFSFLQASAESRQLVDCKMAEVAAVVEWETYDNTSTSVELTCTITHTMEEAHTMARTWRQDVSTAFQDVLAKHFASEKIGTLQEAWKPLMSRIGYVNELDHTKIAVVLCDDTFNVTFTGLIKEVDVLSSKLKGDHSKVQEEMKKAATIATETNTGFSLPQLRMLNARAFGSQQQKRFSDLTVEIDTETLEVRFTGIPEEIRSAKCAMYDILNNITERCIEMSAEVISELSCKDMMEQMMGQFKNRKICAVYECIEGTKLGVYALNEEDLSTATEVIQATTGHSSGETYLSIICICEHFNIN